MSPSRPIAAIGTSFVAAFAIGCSGAGAPAGSAADERKTWTAVQDVVAFSDPEGQVQIGAVEPWGTAGFVAVGSGPRGAAVWSSTDGESWRRIPDAEAFRTAGGAGMAALDVTGGDLVAVGIGDSETIAAVWVSTDGEAWSRPFEASAEEYPAGMAGVARTSSTSVAVGIGLPDPDVEQWVGAAWTSTDLETWTPTADMSAVSPISLNDVVAAGPGFVAVGGVGGSIAVSSPDGAQWTVAALPDGPASNSEWRRLAVAGDRIVAVGTEPGLLLSSVDGTSWTTLRCGNADTAPSLSAIAAGQKGFIAAGSDEAGPVVWSSPDGTTWESVTGLPALPGGSVQAVATGVGRAAIVGTTPDTSAFVWTGPEDGRGDHPTTPLSCTAG